MKHQNTLTISDITKCVKNNKQNMQINLVLESEFEQSNIFKTNNRQTLSDKTIETSNSDKTTTYSNSDIIYMKNGVITIPDKLNSLFDNLLQDNYYLYGVNKENSFLVSLLNLLSKDFKYKEESEILKFIVQLKTILIDNLNKYFRDGNYSSKKFKKIDIENNIESNNFENNLLYYISDYYNINLIILDYYKMNYNIGKEFNQDLKNIIIIKNNTYYLPLIHIYGEFPNNIIYKCVVNKLKTNNKLVESNSESKSESNSESNSESKCESSESNSEFKSESMTINIFGKNNKVKAMSGFKLDDLKQLAVTKNISLKTNSNKNKTKKDLYDEIIKLN
jgi:hypothetical protein